MRIIIDKATFEYDQGVHPEVTEILYKRYKCEGFFEGNRFPNLDTLSLFSFYQERLELRALPVRKLHCNGNGVKELVLDLPNLENLSCRRCRITKLEMNCTSLLELDCNGNQLTELELHAHLLETLNCSHNKLERLVLNCPKLVDLDCTLNNLPEIQLDCPALEYLWCSHNPLKNLDGLEFCTELISLICSFGMEEIIDVLLTHLPKISVKYQI